MEKANTITVGATINASIETVWDKWTDPKEITKWNNASDDWHTPKAENNLTIGGKFIFTMAAKDDSAGFDFNGIYTNIKPFELIEYTIEGGRKVIVSFKEENGKTIVTESFEMENMNSRELQEKGWQAILNNFKKHVEQKN